jgi:hypothetical protein
MPAGQLVGLVRQRGRRPLAESAHLAGSAGLWRGAGEVVAEPAHQGSEALNLCAQQAVKPWPTAYRRTVRLVRRQASPNPHARQAIETPADPSAGKRRPNPSNRTRQAASAARAIGPELTPRRDDRSSRTRPSWPSS